MPARSWLFAPGHSERFLHRVFEAGADEPLLDLEDGVGPDLKERARAQVQEVLASRPAWVRVNRPGTPAAELDRAAVAATAKGIRLPKVEGPEDVAWVRERLGGRAVPLTCTIESAAGAARVRDIASATGVVSLCFGNADFSADLGIDPDYPEASLHVRSELVLASRLSGIQPPSDGVYTKIDDEDGLRAEAVHARRLGFLGKSCIHPRQVAVVNDVFTPSAAEQEWARRVLAAYAAAAGSAARTADGEMVDEPVAARARHLLELVR